MPASLSRQLTEVHQEGIRIPPNKLYDQGKLNQALLDVMLTNVRMPDQNLGDLKAQIAAMNTGERKVHDMVRKFGVEVFRQGVKDLLDLGERQARALLSRIPDGDYFFADYLDEDAPGGVPVRLALTLQDPRRRGDPRLLRLRRPASIVAQRADRRRRASHPADGRLHLLPLQHRSDDSPERRHHAAGALRHPRRHDPQPAIPGRRRHAQHDLRRVCRASPSARSRRRCPTCLPAGPAGSSAIMNVKTTDNRSGRTIMASIDPITGGAGGWSGGDGADGSGANSSFLKNTPVEINETEVPIKVLRYGLVPDTGGAGRHRGGLAHPARVQGVRAQHRGDGAQPRPHALLGVGQQRRPAGRHLVLLAQS